MKHLTKGFAVYKRRIKEEAWTSSKSVCVNWLKSSCIIARIDNWQSDYTRIMMTGRERDPWHFAF